MVLSYKVRFWEIRERADRGKAFEVRWTVNSREKSESFLAGPRGEPQSEAHHRRARR
jgi:hypothetical protein